MNKNKRLPLTDAARLWANSPHVYDAPKNLDFSKERLRRADLSHSYLEGANFSRADLKGANLSYSFLVESNFSLSILQGANLQDADLTGANLQTASLRGARLQFSHLVFADLSHTDLSHADLTGANLSGANLSGAYLLHTKGIGTKAGERKFAGDLLRSIESGVAILEMGLWHSGGNVHDIAGHAFPELEIPGQKASLLFPTLARYFFSENSEALAALQRVAEGVESVFPP